MSFSTRTSTRQLLLGTGLMLIAGSVAHAGVFVVESFHLGGFYAVPEGAPPLIPDNDMTFQNYFMGHTSIPSIPITTTERRTFFAFDLSSVVIPEGEMIVSAEFELELLFGGIIANMTDGFEAVSFTGTSLDYSVFSDPLGSGLGPDEIFDEMGTGDFYGGTGFDDMTLPGEVAMEMSLEALFDMESSIAVDEAFLITGKLDTYDPAMDALFEFVFGLTDVVADGSPTGLAVPKLTITTGPVPAPGSLLVLAGGLMIGNRRRR